MNGDGAGCSSGLVMVGMPTTSLLKMTSLL